jgi:hypothetical protein
MTVEVADAYANVQRLVSAVKMATVLGAFTTEEQSSLVRFFFRAKGLDPKDIHKEMFPVYGGMCWPRKAVQNCIE